MTLGGRIISLFPLFYFLLNGFFLARLLLHPSLLALCLLPIGIYTVPLICNAIHLRLFPFDDGAWDLSKKEYNPWWATHMFQFPFIALPWLESLIHFVPGLYSVWLRAWGSKIGRGIYWTPRVEIVDRGLVEIGDKTIVGHIAGMCCHMVELFDGKPTLVIKKIKIGKHCLVGIDSQLGPGTIVPDGTKLKAKSRLYWRGQWP